jgi:hypothetical protein
VDPVPDPLVLRKPGSAGNRTRTSGSVARNSAGMPTKRFDTTALNCSDASLLESLVEAVQRVLAAVYRVDTSGAERAAYNRWPTPFLMPHVLCGQAAELLINKFVRESAFSARQLDWTTNVLSNFL